MTRITHETSSRPSRLRRIALAGVIAGVASVTTFSIGADAARRTTSEVIATEADRAVVALERWNETQNPVDYVRFVQSRDLTASMIESDVELVPGALADAWPEVSITKQHALLNALSQLGVPYDYLASEPGVGFDCSGLLIWAFGDAGVELARVSRDQFNESAEVERGDAEAGDVVFYPGHISIYLGAETMVHSPNSGNSVEVAPLPDRKSLRFGDTVDRTADNA